MSSTKPGEIVLVDLDPTKGGEKGKTRPCLVLVGSGHPWRILIVAPITDINDGTRSKKLFVPIPHPDSDTGLTKESCIDCFQIRCLAESRILKKTRRDSTRNLRCHALKNRGYFKYRRRAYHLTIFTLRYNCIQK